MTKEPVRIGFSKTFKSTQSDMVQFNGTPYVILEELPEQLYDKPDTGNMYVIQLETGQMLDVFEDEISEYK